MEGSIQHSDLQENKHCREPIAQLSSVPAKVSDVVEQRQVIPSVPLCPRPWPMDAERGHRVAAAVGQRFCCRRRVAGEEGVSRG